MRVLVVLPVAVASVGVGLWLTGDRDQSPAQPVPVAEIRASQSCRSVAFRLVGRPKVTRAAGDLHGALPSLGKNRYVYRGRIEFVGRTGHLRVDGFEPIALLCMDDVYYLVAQEYFGARAHFQMLQFDASGEFLLQDPLSVHEQVRHVDFSNADLDYFFKVWWLGVLHGAGRHAEAAACFQDYVDRNARFAYRPGWLKHRDTEFSDFLQREVRSQRRLGYVSGLQAVAEHAGPGDDPQVLISTLLALVDLESEAGIESLEILRKRVRAEGQRRDERLVAIDWVDRVIRDQGRASQTQPDSARAAD